MTKWIRSPRRAGGLPLTHGLGFAVAVSALLAALLAVTATAGLLFGPHGLYDATTRPAFVGQDAVSLVAGLPLLLTAVWLARRGSLRGLLLWLGALFYIAYNYAFYVLGARFSPLFLAYVALVSLSMYALLFLLIGFDAEALRARVAGRLPERLLGGFLMLMALLFAVLWLGAILTTLANGASPRAVDRTVWTMDLTILLPILFVGGLLLWRRQAWGYVLAGLLLVKVAFTGLTLVIITWAAAIWGQALDPLLPAYAFVGVGGLVGAVRYLIAITPAESTAPAPMPASRLAPHA